MSSVKHIISSSEIDGGFITITKRDGMREFFKKYENQRFSMTIRGNLLTMRKINQSGRIWTGWDIMKMFNPGDILSITNDNTGIIID